MNGERLTETKTKKRNLSKLPSLNEWGAPGGSKKTKKQHLSKLPSHLRGGVRGGVHNYTLLSPYLDIRHQATFLYIISYSHNFSNNTFNTSPYLLIVKPNNTYSLQAKEFCPAFIIFIFMTM